MKINGYEWEVLIVDRKEIDGDDGQCRTRQLQILIADDLVGEPRLVAFIHELTHAILNTSGRYYQKKFDTEEVCEFIGWCYPIYEKCINEFVERIGL